MKSGIYEVHVRSSRRELQVQTFGRTPRGTKFLKEAEILQAKTPSDPGFKEELAAAVEKLLGTRQPRLSL